MTNSIPDWVKRNNIIDTENLTNDDYNYLTEWVHKNHIKPEDYLVEKCDDYQVVFLGEHHQVENYIQFLIKVIPRLYNEANVTRIGLEVCNKDDNEKIEKLVTNDKFDENLQLEIARSQNWQGWAYKDYWEILRAVWKFNKSLTSEQDKLLVKGIDKKLNFPKLRNWLDFGNEPKEDEKEELLKKAKNYGDRDELMSNNIEEEIIKKNKKAIILIGNLHCFTDYKMPIIKKGKITDEKHTSTAYLLEQKYKEKIFSIRLHSPLPAVKNIKEDHLGGAKHLRGVIDEIIEKTNIKKTAFDISSSPFSSLRNNKCLFFHNQKEITYKDVFKGYIVVAPLKDLYRCEMIPDFITEEMFENSKGFLSNKFERDFKNTKDMNEFLYQEREKAFPEFNN